MLNCRMILPILVTAFMVGCSSKPPAKPAAPASSPTVVRTTKSKPAAVSLSSIEASILQEVNRHRASKGLSPLVANSILDTEASLHSQQMASGQVSFGHSGYEARMARIDKRMGGAGANAENVAYGKMTAREVVQSWLRSPPHKKNIEGPYHSSGIGISRNGQGVIYFTQIFTQK